MFRTAIISLLTLASFTAFPAAITSWLDLAPIISDWANAVQPVPFRGFLVLGVPFSLYPVIARSLGARTLADRPEAWHPPVGGNAWRGWMTRQHSRQVNEQARQVDNLSHVMAVRLLLFAILPLPPSFPPW